MVAKQIFIFVLLASVQLHASPMPEEKEEVGAPPAVPNNPSDVVAQSDAAVVPETHAAGDEKWIIPLINLALAPAPTTPTPKPGPPPQVIIMPQNSTLSVVSQQPINIQQGSAPTTFTASAPGPNPMTVTTGK